jgi:hypothetical protein
LRFAGRLALTLFPFSPMAAQQIDWPIHSMDRPLPPVVTPGRIVMPVPPPSDAIVLFDGRSLAGWTADSGKARAMDGASGYFEVNPGTGSIMTSRGFGDVQLHVEWATPSPPRRGAGSREQRRLLMRTYEVQVLDTYRKSHLCRRHGGRDLRPVPALGECLTPAW